MYNEDIHTHEGKMCVNVHKQEAKEATKKNLKLSKEIKNGSECFLKGKKSFKSFAFFSHILKFFDV